MTVSTLDYLSIVERREMDFHLSQLTNEPTADTPEAPYFDGNLHDYVSVVAPRFVWYRHCEMLSEHLEAIVTGELKNLMTFEPPRHGKSLLISRIFPGYVLAKRPRWYFGLASYAATLAEDFSRTARDGYVRVGGKIRGDSSAVDHWQTVQDGGMWAVGVGGPLTGRGFNVGSIDDPLKNKEEADSETIRSKHKGWYDSTFFTRAEPDAAKLITQTRWNEDDLSGYILEREKEDPEDWTIINLPALADAESAKQKFPVTCTVVPDWRRPGSNAALCPERYDQTKLLNIKRKVGSRIWDALFQQRPAPDEGVIFLRKWWKFYTIPDRPIAGVPFLPTSFDYMMQSWDMSFKDTKGSDFVSGQVWATLFANIYLLDRINDRLDFTATCVAMLGMTAKWPKTVAKYVEDKANGSAIINALQKEVMGIVPVTPDGGKIARAYAVQGLPNSGCVFLPHPLIAPWIEDFISQLAAFPNAAHDDDVDAATQAFNHLTWVKQAEQPPPKEASDDQHPGYDMKNKARRPRRASVVDGVVSTIEDEDDGRIRYRSELGHFRPSHDDEEDDE